MDQISLLKEAASEINRSHCEIKHLRARLDMFDSIMGLLNTNLHKQGRVAQNDIAYNIKTYLQAMGETEDSKLSSAKADIETLTRELNQEKQWAESLKKQLADEKARATKKK